MSAALVKKSLDLLESNTLMANNPSRGKKQKHNNLIPENMKLKKKISRNRKKIEVSLIKTNKKFTVMDAKRTHKAKSEIVKENKIKIKLIQDACKIDLDEEMTKDLFLRAIIKRPLTHRRQHKKEQTTAFTEEDFKKFEEEYYDESNEI